MSSRIAKQSTAVATPAGVRRRPPDRRPAWDDEEERRYPSSDGRPMAQSKLQGTELTQAYYTLARHYRDRPDVEVCPDVLVYYREGADFEGSLAPDVMVAFGVRKDRRRRTYKVWQEGRPPDWVLEVVSKKTYREDTEPDRKQRVYSRMGVREVWLFDPDGEFIRPRLQGLHLAGAGYRPLPRIEVPQARLALHSPVLDLQFHARGDTLRIWDPQAGRYLRTIDESEEELEAAEQGWRKAEQARRKAEQGWREEQQARREEQRGRLEAERHLQRERQTRVRAEQELEALRQRLAAQEGQADAAGA